MTKSLLLDCTTSCRLHFLFRAIVSRSRITKMAKQPPVCLYIIEYYIQSLAFLYARNSSQQVKTAEQIAKPQFEHVTKTGYITQR
jgi:hypothetical protein